MKKSAVTDHVEETLVSGISHAGHARVAEDLRVIECFVSMPFSPDFETVYAGGIGRVQDHLTQYTLDLVRLDKEVYMRRRLEENVLKHIERSDLLIADITRYKDTLVPNVSVMHEIGYASGREIPFILIGLKDTHKNLPSNLQGSIMVEYELRDEPHLKSFAMHLARQISEVVRQQVLDKVRGDYKVDCFLDRSRIDLPRLVQKASRRILILTTNLDYTNTHLKNAIQDALSNNATQTAFKVEILAMDPESDVANARAVQLGRSIREYRDELRSSLDEMRAVFDKIPRVEIRTYRTLPTQMTFIVDDIVINAIVALGQQSRDGVHFVVCQQLDVTQSFLQHFRVLKALAMGAA